MYQIIKYIKLHNNGDVTEKHFFHFIQVQKKTVDSANYTIKKFRKNKINLQNCRSRGLDNVSIMTGAYNSVQWRIIKENNTRVYAESFRCLLISSIYLQYVVGTKAFIIIVEMATLFGEILDGYRATLVFILYEFR